MTGGPLKNGKTGAIGYYKATYGASAPGVSVADPSVNHLIFAPGAGGAKVTLSETTDDDLHEVIFPQGLNLVYYVLWAGKEGYHYKREAFQTASRHHCARTPRAPPPRVRSAAPPPHPPLHLSTSSVRYLCTSAGARPPRRVVRAPRLHAAARPRRRGRRRRRHRHPHHHVRPAPPHHRNPRAVRMVLPPPLSAQLCPGGPHGVVHGARLLHGLAGCQQDEGRYTGWHGWLLPNAPQRANGKGPRPRTPPPTPSQLASGHHRGRRCRPRPSP